MTEELSMKHPIFHGPTGWHQDRVKSYGSDIGSRTAQAFSANDAISQTVLLLFENLQTLQNMTARFREPRARFCLGRGTLAAKVFDPGNSEAADFFAFAV